MRPARLFIAPFSLAGSVPVRIIRDTHGEHPVNTAQAFKRLPKEYAFTGFLFVTSLEEADFILAPNAVRRLDAKTVSYIAQVKTFAEEAEKKVVFFLGKDDSHDLHIDDAIVFCKSIYRQTKRKNEIQTTPFVEDLSEQVPFAARKKSARPVVSFCGYASFPSWKTHAKYVVKNSALDLGALLTGNPDLRAYKRGIFFRREAIRLLRKDPRIQTNFIIRNSYSGDTRNLRETREASRREYLENMQNSDFVLAPKGDANHSDRFFEALSLGRIPILIDTDMVLPLEGIVDYSKCIIRVPHTDIRNIASYVADAYAALSDEKFAAMQEAARQAFRQYLRYDAFFNTALPLLIEHSPQTLDRL